MRLFTRRPLPVGLRLLFITPVLFSLALPLMEDHPKTGAGRRTIPSAAILADTAREWIAAKSQMIGDMGLMPALRMPPMSDGPRPHACNAWRKHWVKLIDENGFAGIRPYSLRHTFATLDLYAGCVPSTAMGIGGGRHIDCIRSAGQDCGFIY